MNDFIPILKQTETGGSFYCCPTCGRRCPKPKNKQKGRPKATGDNYVVQIKQDDTVHEFRFASLNEAAARLNELGYKSITRFNLMYCHKGKFSYPHMKVSKLT